jgi:hypothetical protein
MKTLRSFTFLAAATAWASLCGTQAFAATNAENIAEKVTG